MMDDKMFEMFATLLLGAIAGIMLTALVFYVVIAPHVPIVFN